jgi:hypothetical protein
MLPILVWPLQWIKDHPYQALFWVLPILLSIPISVFGNDIRALVGVQYASLKQKWLQVRYVSQLKALTRKSVYRANPNVLMMHILSVVLGFSSVYGLVVFMASFLMIVRSPAMPDHKASWLLVGFTAYFIAYVSVYLTLRYGNQRSTKAYLKQVKAIEELRSQLENAGIDVTVLETRNGLSFQEVMRPNRVR